MANYQIPMTGAQITDALTQLVNRVAEGWAVGSRDGNPVSSGSPYYHNNAKYYSENAAASAARAEAAVPASTAGAVFFDRSQSLTDAQKGQAQNNIGAGNNNPNLLDNPFFTINQRGFTTNTSTSSFNVADRWKVAASGSGNTMKATLDANGLTYGVTGSTQNCWLLYNFPDPSIFAGKQITASVLMQNGTVYSGTITRVLGTGQNFFSITNPVSPDGATSLVMLFSTANDLRIRVYGGTIAIRAVKIEIGAVSTLANDVPPNPVEELAKCKRYFRRITPLVNRPIAVGFAWSATDLRIDTNLPIRAMATTPTVAVSGAFKIVGNGSNSTDVSSITAGISGGQLFLGVTTSGLTPYLPYSIYTATQGSYIDISADL